jgi:hypothetical protein
MTINNNNIFGAFTLNEARGSRLTGDWLNKESVANYGWFGGGHFNSAGNIALSSVERVDFSNDTQTASTKGVLSAARGYLAATSNSNYGWYAGGNPGTVNTALSTVDRIDFSNDTPSASPRGTLGVTKAKAAATGNSNYGWFGGGYFTGSSSNTESIVVRIDYSNDSSIASLRSPLVFASSTRAATGNSNYGWFGGATSNGSVSRIDFSNDYSTASPRGSLSAAKYNSAATGNSNYGWFGGGRSSVPAIISRVDRIDFSNDSTISSIRGPLSSSRYNLSATGNSNYGWFGGGANPGTTGLSTIDRIDFSNDSATASPRGVTPAPSARYGIAATSGVLNIRRQKAGNFGWFAGGFAPSPVGGSYSTVDRIDFSNDSTTVVRGSVVAPSVGKYGMLATGNSNYGWFGGGYTHSPFATVSSVDRIDFSNDGVTASVRGPLSRQRKYGAATGNSNYGWFGGDQFSGVAPLDRINFSNDLASAPLKGGALSIIRGFMAATGNSNYSWFGGGYVAPAVPPANFFSTVDRIDFSNDSTSASPRGPLSLARHELGATGNSNYGWFAGGIRSPSPNVYTSLVDRIDFSNDSASALLRGSLNSPAGRVRMGATGNSNYGWFGGGTIFPFTNPTIDRIDFSNDSATASTRGGLLSTARDRIAAVSNTPT